MSKSITDRVKELEKENRLLTANLVDAIWVIDAETLRYDYTSSSEGIGGYTAKELIGKSIFNELTPDSSKKATEVLRNEMRALKRGEHAAQSLELELVHKDGGKYWIEIRAKLLEEPGKPLKIVGITKDITARKKAEQEQKRLNEKLTEALAEKERLLEEIKVLKKLLPICSGCKRIRDDDGKWWPIDIYVKEHTGSDFTHTICLDCKDVMYPDLKKGS